MLFNTLSGKKVSKGISKYKIDWDKKSLGKSKFGKLQTEVKNFFREFWEKHVVYEELPCFGTGTRMRLDFLNLTQNIAVEVNGPQHDEYIEFFHGDRRNFGKQIVRDVNKAKWCEINGFNLINIYSTSELCVKLLEERGILL